MHKWAIHAVKLEKKFPRRVAVHKTAETAGKVRSWWRKLATQRTEKTWSTAVDSVSLLIQSGEVFGLLGPNGAGKTTTIRMLCTLLEPTSGTARVNGYDILTQPNQVRLSLGILLAGERSIYWKLTARENLAYFAALYHIPPKIANKRIAEVLDRLELTARADELVERYSTGMRQRVAIGKALLAKPPILMLDEPTLGLDPQAARRIRELVLELKDEGHTILLTTHYMEEADQLSDRIGIIDQGKIIALDTPEELKRRINQKDVIRLEVAGWEEKMGSSLRSLPQVENLISRYMGTDSLWEVSLHVNDSRAALPDVLDMVNVNGSRMVNMNVVQPSLEDVFINLTGKALRD